MSQKRLKTNAKAAKTQSQQNLMLRESEFRRLLIELDERYPISSMVQRSYLLSRLWAWCSKVQLRPNVRIPVPRFLTHRDP